MRQGHTGNRKRSEARAARAAFGGVILLCLVAGLASCATGRRQPHDGVRELWNEYRDLARHKALALAGDPDRAWVSGAVGGFETSRAAQRAALARCDERRRDRRFQSPCRLYAVGDRIVW